MRGPPKRCGQSGPPMERATQRHGLTAVAFLHVAADRSYVPQSDPDPARLPEGVVHRVSRLGLPLDSASVVDSMTMFVCLAAKYENLAMVPKEKAVWQRQT